MLTIEQLNAALEYDSETGIFRRVWADPRGGAKVGDVAGCIHYIGGAPRYIKISIKSRQYFAHHLAWLALTGSWPALMIDHVNGDGTDNRANNLRLCTRGQNQWNSKIRRNNRSGVKGVSFESHTGTFVAQICAHNKRKFIGRYRTAEEAHEAWKQAAAIVHGKFARAA